MPDKKLKKESKKERTLIVGGVTFTVILDVNQQPRWRAKYRNGELACGSLEPFDSRGNAWRAIDDFFAALNENTE